MTALRSTQLPVGWEAPDFELPDVNEQKFNLERFAAFPGLLVVFTCNHCPYAKAAWPLLVELHQKFRNQVAFVAINPNDAEQYPEDSVEGMKGMVERFQVSFPYLRDESQEVARAYQAQCTPDPYLFKNEGGDVFSLFYHGRINDNWQHPDRVTDHSLRRALQKLTSNSTAPEVQKPSMGCSIKWIEDSK